MNVFATALATLHADPNGATPADYRQGGQGPAARVRVIRAVAEPEAAPLGFNLKARADTLQVRMADCPHLAMSDTFVLFPDTAPELVTVTQTALDAEGMSFIAVVRRS
jgi:hypothetical protein